MGVRGIHSMDDTPVDQQLPTQTVRPCLAIKARLQIDKVTGEPVLLYPEGVLLLNATGVAIIELCNGQRTISEIVTELAGRYHVTPEHLQDDISEYIIRLYKHSLLELRPAGENPEPCA